MNTCIKVPKEMIEELRQTSKRLGLSLGGTLQEAIHYVIRNDIHLTYILPELEEEQNVGISPDLLKKVDRLKNRLMFKYRIDLIKSLFITGIFKEL